MDLSLVLVTAVQMEATTPSLVASLAVDTVLSASRPALSDADAIELAHTCFGVAAAAARDLGSERDRAFALDASDGEPVAILKVSNASEDPEVLDMEAEAGLHVIAADPGLRVAVPRRAAGDSDPAHPAAMDERRARWS